MAAGVRLLIDVRAVPQSREPGFSRRQLAAALADGGYDGGKLRRFLTERGTLPVIPNNPRRINLHPFDWRRIATRYDKLAINYASAVAIAAIAMWWT